MRPQYRYTDRVRLHFLVLPHTPQTFHKKTTNNQIYQISILEIERQVAEQRLFLLSKLNENPSSTSTIALELGASPVSQVVKSVEKRSLPEKQLAAVFNAKELLVLTDIVTASMADRFKDQSLRPGFNCGLP